MDINKEYGDFLVKIGLNISYYRKLRGFSQDELAEKVGLSRTTIGHIEAPDMYYGMKLSTIYKISKALDISPSNFFEFKRE